MPFILFEIELPANNNDAYVEQEYIYNNRQLYVDRINLSVAYQAMRDNLILLYIIIKSNYLKTNHLIILSFSRFFPIKAEQLAQESIIKSFDLKQATLSLPNLLQEQSHISILIFRYLQTILNIFP